MRKIGENEFQVLDSYYDDGEGGGRAGLKRRSYKLRLLAPDKIELKQGNYPSSQFVRCPSDFRAAKSDVTVPPSNEAVQKKSSNASKPNLAPDSKIKETILFIYQQYLVLKICEAKGDGLINLNATRENLKKFDKSIRAKGYDPEAMFAQAKEVPFNEGLKILLVSVSMLPMSQGAEKAQLLSVCQRLIQNEAQSINLATNTLEPQDGSLEKAGEKDF
ncbi:hypothetical protein G6321_00045910 [Bradyrhizobium barranii subsp. barranii]|uniref:Uncharacterized protein n=1 Tax=Bradyrhizobium barranii subsp. barranii TaxID=2823807 RepID=A0A7Z0QC36_9BRAD|nr:hypothetical protein [Bradyrhizobium barranii]UGX92891.1 hypothetical protein G6321_00045910 [Bradyrhizobium barranii subsp. barranii]